MKRAGYATGMFGKWHLGNDAQHHPGKRGFDEAIESSGRHFNFQTDPPTPHDPDAYLADFLTDKAVDFIRRHKSEPFFLYLPHFGVHSPFQAKTGMIAQLQTESAGRRPLRPDVCRDDRQRRRKRRPRCGDARRIEAIGPHVGYLHQ